jgi:hypothetical protein
MSALKIQIQQMLDPFAAAPHSLRRARCAGALCGGVCVVGARAGLMSPKICLRRRWRAAVALLSPAGHWGSGWCTTVWFAELVLLGRV